MSSCSIGVDSGGGVRRRSSAAGMLMHKGVGFVTATGDRHGYL